MNLKEAFRYQNKLQELMDTAKGILQWDKNVTRVESTALLHKVNPQAQDETTVEQAETEFADQITEIASLLMHLLDQRELLGRAINQAKRQMQMDFDGEVSLNTKRQELSKLFRHMASIRCAETLIPRGGLGYKFNAEGNQVSYRCDLKQVTSIHFDRNKVRGFATALSKVADATSAELDRQLVITQVDYQPPFDVNDTFPEVLQQYIDQNS